MANPNSQQPQPPRAAPIPAQTSRPVEQTQIPASTANPAPPTDPLDAAAASSWVRDMAVMDFNEGEGSGDHVIDLLPKAIGGEPVAYQWWDDDTAASDPLFRIAKAVTRHDSVFASALPESVWSGGRENANYRPGQIEGHLYRGDQKLYAILAKHLRQREERELERYGAKMKSIAQGKETVLDANRQSPTRLTRDPASLSVMTVTD